MKYLAYFIFIVLALALQTGVFGYFKIAGAGPNILLLLLVTLSLEKEDYDFFFVSIICGLFLDFYSSLFVGSFLFGFLITAYCLHLAASALLAYEINWKYLLLFLVAAMLISQLWLWGYSALAFKLGWWPERVSINLIRRLFLPEFFYNAVLIYPVYILTRFIKKGLIRLFSRQQVIN